MAYFFAGHGGGAAAGQNDLPPAVPDKADGLFKGPEIKKTGQTPYFGGFGFQGPFQFPGNKRRFHKAHLKLFQNFSFWNSFLRFNRKTGPLAGFSKSLSKTNRVLDKLTLL
jgi:hypothetical protein